MKLTYNTSGSVIGLIVANLPLTTSRLGEAEVMRGFLKLLHQMTGKAPRGLRPMMENLDELLSKLTLGGLRRWVMRGAQAHQRDLDGQLAYFGLQPESSKSVLQIERRGTLFIDNQRKLNFYLRALWARAFFMRPTVGDFEPRQGIRPYIDDFQIHVPDAFDPFRGIDGIEVYRATAAHAAAHMVYTREPISAEQLSQAQMGMIDLFEDARVAYLAYSEFPGLLSWSIDSIGDNYAVHGFASDGRHDVQYYRFNDFEPPYDDAAKSRLAGETGGLYTCMGAALRHAGSHLTQQNAEKRLVLLVTDGEPADIDERDPQYLRYDTKKAVEDLAMQGVYTYYLTLDPNADQYVYRIFSENNYSIVDHVERLPERLPNVFVALTG